MNKKSQGVFNGNRKELLRIGAWVAVILALFAVIFLGGYSEVAVQRHHDLEYLVPSGDLSAVQTYIRTNYTAPVKIREVSLTPSIEESVFVDTFYDSEDGLLESHGRKLRFRSISEEGIIKQTIVEILGASSGSFADGNFSYSRIRLQLNSPPLIIAPKEPADLYSLLTPESLSTLQKILSDAGIDSVETLRRNFSISQDRVRLKFTNDKVEIFSVAVGNSKGTKNGKGYLDFRIIFQLNEKYLASISGDDSAALQEFSKSVIENFKARFPKLELAESAMADRFAETFRTEGL